MIVHGSAVTVPAIYAGSSFAQAPGIFAVSLGDVNTEEIKAIDAGSFDIGNSANTNDLLVEHSPYPPTLAE